MVDTSEVGPQIDKDLKYALSFMVEDVFFVGIVVETSLIFHPQANLCLSLIFESNTTLTSLTQLSFPLPILSDCGTMS